MWAQDVGEALLSRWKLVERQLIALVEVMPEDGFQFRPQTGALDGVRTFGEQVKRIACANTAFFLEIEGKAPPAGCGSGGPDPAKTKAELVRYLRTSFASGDAVIAQTTNSNLLTAVEGPYGGASNRLGIITLAVWHASDHYGQLVVFARMKGIVPPASR